MTDANHIVFSSGKNVIGVIVVSVKRAEHFTRVANFSTDLHTLVNSPNVAVVNRDNDSIVVAKEVAA